MPLIHMLSAFELKPGEDETAFRAAYAEFADDLMKEGLIVEAGPIGTRVANTPMDTDDARTHTHFSMLSFRDRAQLDAAYAHIARRKGAVTGSHYDMTDQIINGVFLCWQDGEHGKPAT